MISPEITKKIRLIRINTRKTVTTAFAGQYASVFKGRGMEFDEVREYQMGDDVRTIDWNVTARTGTLHTKRFLEERELTVLFLVDLSSSQAFGSGRSSKGEVAAEICAVLALSAIKNNDRVGLLLFTSEVELFVPPRKGMTHMLRLLRDMLTFTPRHRGTSVSSALDFVGKVLRRRVVLFLVSDFLDDGYEQKLRTIASHHDVIAVPLTDPREIALPEVGLLSLEDAETGSRLLLDTTNRAVRTSYTGWRRAHATKLDRILIGAGVDRIPVTVGEDYVKPIVRFFLARERRFS